MFYKLLGMAVWKGTKWYLGRRFPKPPGKALAIGGGAALLLAVGVAITRRLGG